MHTITAVYAGDSNFSDSTSNVLVQTVNQDTTTTVLYPGSTAVLGQNNTMSTTVFPDLPGSGTPTGTVTFAEGDTTLGTGVLVNGTATLTSNSFILGANTITVIYSGDGNFIGSTGSATIMMVEPPDATPPSFTAPSLLGRLRCRRW